MTLEFRPLTSTFGAEVLGVDPSQPLDAETQKELRAGFDKYRMLLFRNAEMNAAQQARFGEVFGPHAPRPPVPEGMLPAGEENTQYVSNRRADGILPNGELFYHQDHTFDEEPVRAIMLYGVEVPSAGGATKFRSCADIYKSMDEPTRALAETVNCLHLFDYTQDIQGIGDDRQIVFSLDNVSPGAPRKWQPLVFRDPRGGDPSAWVIFASTADFEGVSFDEGVKLLGDILDQAEDVNEYHHQWRVGDALIWNNLHLQHARVAFESGEPRTLRRTTLM